jgi:hypothetical protein
VCGWRQVSPGFHTLKSRSALAEIIIVG